jgi:AcrR family transcriptional regulator
MSLCESSLTFAGRWHHVKVSTASPTTRRPADRRAQIALAAAQLFNERGYPAVGIDDIAAAVGISGPAVYRHFPTKYAILAHASQELTGEILAATAELSTLDDLVPALVAVAVRRREVGGLYQWEGRYLLGEDRSRLRHALVTLLERLSSPLRAERPQLSPVDSDLLSRAVLSLLGSLATHRSPAPPAQAEQVLRDAARTLARAPLRAVPTPRAAPEEPAEPASRRDALLTAALALFHQRGYYEVTMEEIGRAVGLSASGLYRHFPSKAELLAAACHRAADEVAARTARALATADGPADALDRLIESYVDLVYGHPDLVGVYPSAHGALPAADRHELRKTQRLHVEEWVRLVVALRPALDPVAARLLVHGALNVGYDLAQIGADRARVTGLARTVLLS